MKLPSIIMQSDFGSDSGLVSCMHGVCKSVNESLEVHHITHDLPSFDIRSASSTLQYVLPCWPSGTVVVSVVDPGVGTSRKACVAKLKNGSYIVTPDNGTLTYVGEMIGIESVREIDDAVNRREETRDVSVFHGRDLFAYCAAKLAAGIITYEEVGPEYPVDDIITHSIHKATVTSGLVHTEITGADPFGSVELSVSNLEFSKAEFAQGEKVDISIRCDDNIVFHDAVLYERSFGYVELSKEILFNDLASFVTLGCNQDSFVKKHNIDMNKLCEVTISRIKYP